MAFKGLTITIGDSPTQIVPVPGAPGRAWNDPIRCIIKNAGTGSVFLGGPNVTTSGPNKGYVLATTDEPIEVEVESNDVLYGVVASGTTQTLSVLLGRQ